MTIMERRFILDPDSIGALAPLVPGPKSPVSPLNRQAKGHLTEPELRRLQLAGVLDQRGAPSADMLPTLEALARPSAFAQIRFFSGPSAMEQTVLFSADGRSPLCVTPTAEGLLIRDPCPIEEIASTIGELVGRSILQTTEFSAELEIAGALVFGALVDQYRKAALAAIADEKPFSQPVSSAVDIHTRLVQATDDMQWLLTAIRQCVRNPPSLSPNEVEASLATLVAAGYVTRDSIGYSLSQTTAELAGSLLLVHRIISIQAGRESDVGGIVFVEVTLLHYGLHDLLLLTEREGRIAFEIVSQAVAVEIISDFLRNPSAVQELATVPAAPSVAKSGRKCPQCGAANLGVVEQCLICRAPLGRSQAADLSGAIAGATTPHFCGRCGKQLKPGKRFCTGCGHSTI